MWKNGAGVVVAPLGPLSSFPNRHPPPSDLCVFWQPFRVQQCRQASAFLRGEACPPLHQQVLDQSAPAHGRRRSRRSTREERMMAERGKPGTKRCPFAVRVYTESDPRAPPEATHLLNNQQISNAAGYRGERRWPGTTVCT